MKMDKYITGKYALNIHHPENYYEPTGDWHGYIWDNIKELPNDKVTYAGEGFKINTFHIWDDFGVYDDTDNLRRKGIKINEDNIYIADYYRAILDLVCFSLYNYNNLFGLNGITYDHLDDNGQVAIVLNKIKKMKCHIDNNQLSVLEKWIENEKNYECAIISNYEN